MLCRFSPEVTVPCKMKLQYILIRTTTSYPCLPSDNSSRMSTDAKIGAEQERVQKGENKRKDERRSVYLEMTRQGTFLADSGLQRYCLMGVFLSACVATHFKFRCHGHPPNLDIHCCARYRLGRTRHPRSWSGTARYGRRTPGGTPLTPSSSMHNHTLTLCVCVFTISTL